MTPAARLAAVLALRVDLRDPDACGRITPEAANAYLAARGWQRFDTETWHVWMLDGAQVVVPRETSWADYGVRMVEMVAAVALHEGRSPIAVYLDLMPEETPQMALPGMAAPPKKRRIAQHRFGLLQWEAAPATEFVPEHLVARETCGHCGAQRRTANTGRRQGALRTYSTDGQAWSRVSPVCVAKRMR